MELNSGKTDIFDYVIICIAPPTSPEHHALIGFHEEVWQQSAGFGQHFSRAVDYENHTATYYMEGDPV